MDETPTEPIPVRVRWYERHDREQWHAGLQLDRVPALERAKCSRPGRRDKYLGQHAKNHYGEVLSMRDLEHTGFSWLYDEYYLFWNRRHPHGSFTERETWIRSGRGVYADGTRELLALLGRERLERLWSRAALLRTNDQWPVEPDLFAWRFSGGDLEFRCIEIKVNTDPIREDQRHGLVLLRDVLGPRCIAEFHHYRPR